MSEWNPSDPPSRKWEKSRPPQRAQLRKSRPRKKAKRKVMVVKGKSPRRNQAFGKKFDGTLGYQGEGPRRAMANAPRRLARSRLRVVPKLAKRRMDVVPVRRTASERRLARKGITLRDGVLKPKTRQLYRAAFLRLWGWIDCPPPERVTNVPAYDRVLAEFIEYAWSAGHTRGDAGNALSSSLAAYPELRGKGNLTESWYMLNSWARYEVPIRAPALPPQVLLA